MTALNYSARLLIMVVSSVWALTAFSEAAPGPPVVNSTIPAGNATNVPKNIPVIAIFSEAMNGSTINTSTFRLEKLVPGTMTFNLTETGGITTTYTASYTTQPFAGIYGGSYWGAESGSFYTGISGSGAIRGFSYNSEDEDYFSTTLNGSSSPWSFYVTSYWGTILSGTVTAASVSGTWNNSGYTGSFSGTKMVGNDGSAGYGKSVYTYGDSYGVAAAEVSGSVIEGALVDISEPDVYHGTGTVYADNTFSIPSIYSGHYGIVVASATGTLNPAYAAVSGTVTYDPSTFSAAFTPSANLSAGSTYRATVTGAVTDATGTPMTANRIWTFTTGDLTANKLTITMNGTGSGEVTSSPSGIACDYPTQTGFCSAYFTVPSVTLSAAADNGSLLTGWGGDCVSCSTTLCNVVLNAFKTCTARFTSQMVLIDGNPTDGYATLQDAYDVAGDDTLLMARDITFSGNVVLDEDKKVRIYGGYNSDFSSHNGVTVIDGSLTVGRGTLTAGELEII